MKVQNVVSIDSPKGAIPSIPKHFSLGNLRETFLILPERT